MNPLPHHYEVHLTGGPSGYAQVSMPGVPGLRNALEKTEKNCLVSASLSTLIRLEPQINEARALVGC